MEASPRGVLMQPIRKIDNLNDAQNVYFPADGSRGNRIG